jgi:membrane protease YdiL (CAAX protease family)
VTPTKRRLLGEVVATWLVTVLLIRVIVALVPTDFLWGLPLAAVPILFMWMPVWVLQRQGIDPDRYPLAIPTFDDTAVWWRDIRLAGVVALAIFVPYLVLYHFWQTAWFPAILEQLCDQRVPGTCIEARRAATWGPQWRFDGGVEATLWFLQLAGYHLFFVAIPEEMFYRGYVQSRLDEVWEPTREVFGARVGWGLVVTCVIFAAGHSLVIVQWWHFAIFFPSLVFGWLRTKSDGIMAGAFFHAFSNVLVAILDRTYGVTLL